MEPQISLRGIEKRFGPRLLYKEVDLDIYPGITLLTGANGTGKSTLLRVMAGLLPPDAGSVVSAMPEEKRAYLGHGTFIYPELTALENLRFWSGMAGARRTDRDLMAALEEVGLAKRADDKAGIFSRGMAQRLNLARILCSSPKLIFLDEPETGLDLSSRDMLTHCIGRFRDDGAGIVWVSHYADPALADAVYSIEKKRLAPVKTAFPGGAEC